MNQYLTLLAVLVLIGLSTTTVAQDAAPSLRASELDKPYLLNYPNLDDPDGEVVLSNEHVVLQRLVVPAGEWEGIHSHPGNQIYVHIKGGEWSGRLGGEIEYWGIPDEDGAVGWMDAIPLSAGHDSGNTGDTPIDLIYVTLKSDAPISPGIAHAQQTFPDVSLELLLENDRMIVQRAEIAPGQWTGHHSHPGNQVYIHITGGSWSERRDEFESSQTSTMAAGTVRWIEAGEAHNVGNAGGKTMDLVLVTLK